MINYEKCKPKYPVNWEGHKPVSWSDVFGDSLID